MRKRWLLLAALALPMLVGTLAPAEAGATFPGQNGKIAFSRGGENVSEPRCVYTANASGTGQVALLPPCDAENESKPRWSPSGIEIAYEGYGGQLDIVNALDNSNLREFFFDAGVGTTGFGWSPDGSQIVVSVFDCDGEGVCESRIERLDSTTGAYTTVLTTPFSYVSDPDWSPNGQLIAFTRDSQLYTINPNGTGLAPLAPGSPGINEQPSWSPSGAKIAFVSDRDEVGEIYVMNADGTGQTRLTDNFALDQSPRWSPDGQKILFESDRDGNNEIYVMNADGTGQTRVTNNPEWDASPDWQSIPITTYARPQGASPMRFSLVPAYAQCVSGNSTHGTPLASPSCNPPSLTSTQLTIGGPETNGKPPASNSFVRYTGLPGDANPGDTADLRVTVHVNDVIRQGTLADYNGELSVRTTVRIIDKSNGPSANNSGTVMDQQLRSTVPCVPTAATTVGATCSVTTSFDALLPGVILEGKRAIWILPLVQVEDGGPDGDAETLTGNTLFMKPGVFVP